MANDKEVSLKPEPSQPFCGLVFKIATDPFVGRLAYIRVYSGHLDAGSYVLNSRSGKKERVARLYQMHSNHQNPIEFVEAGDAAAPAPQAALPHYVSYPAENEPEEQMIEPDAPGIPEGLSMRKAGDELIERALAKHGGKVKPAAAELGISERTIYRKLAEWKEKGRKP